MLLHRIAAALLAFGPAGVFLLALLDSFGVPLPAALDALLLFVAWKTPGRAYWTAALAVVGSLTGNFALYMAARGGRRLWAGQLPPPERPARFRRWFQRYGLVTVFIPAAVPIIPLPLKVFVISAGAMRIAPGRFLAVVLAARVIRYFGDSYLGVQLGAGAQTYFERHAAALGAAAAAVALGAFFLIWLNGRRRDVTML